MENKKEIKDNRRIWADMLGILGGLYLGTNVPLLLPIGAFVSGMFFMDFLNSAWLNRLREWKKNENVVNPQKHTQ